MSGVASRYKTYTDKKKAAGICARCSRPRVNATYCMLCNKEYAEEAKRRRQEANRPYVVHADNTCAYTPDMKTPPCGEIAAYGVFLVTPTWPSSENWTGKSGHNVTYYCYEHAMIVSAPIGCVRRLRNER